MSLLDEFKSKNIRTDAPAAKSSLITSTPFITPVRGITERTTRLYDYGVGKYRQEGAHVANLRDSNGLVVAQKIRYGDKKFAVIGEGDQDKLQMFGQHIGSEGTLVITEGELDAMSVHEALTLRRIKGNYVVVSLINGVGSAKKNTTAQLSWILGFKRVVVFMDMDDPGRKAAATIAELVGPTAAVVGAFPYKDANEAWQAHDHQAILDAVNNAKIQRPDAIIHAPDLLERVLKPERRQGLPFPWKGWNKVTEGMKPGQLIMISGGTGIGKSLFTRSIALDLCRNGTNVAYIGLEESCETSLERMLSEQMQTPLYRDTPEQRALRDPEEIKAALDQFAGHLYLLDKFGSDDFDSFVATVKHYVLAEQCPVIVLDHFSLLADGISLATDQRRAIDRCIKDLKTLCVELNFTMLVVCHLSRSTGIGKPHEEGGEPTLAELRGSHSLAQIPDTIVMLVRNPRAEDSREANTTHCWIKKNRVTGVLGEMSKLEYHPRLCVFTETEVAV